MAVNVLILPKSPFPVNLLKTKRNLLYIRNQSDCTVNTFHHGYKNQSVNDV